MATALIVEGVLSAMEVETVLSVDDVQKYWAAYTLLKVNQ